MNRIIPVIVLLLMISVPGSVVAQTPGPVTAIAPGFDRAAALDRIHEELVNAPDAAIAKQASNLLWQIWLMAPDEQTAEDLNRAIQARNSYDFEKALPIFDEAISRHPDYPEAWNQRSFAHFLRGDFEKSLSDCEHVLTLEPRHIGCLTGMAIILIRHQRRYLAGKGALQEAIRLYPFVQEKALMEEVPKAFR